jgi:hypothetical protein
VDEEGGRRGGRRSEDRLATVVVRRKNNEDLVRSASNVARADEGARARRRKWSVYVTAEMCGLSRPGVSCVSCSNGLCDNGSGGERDGNTSGSGGSHQQLPVRETHG